MKKRPLGFACLFLALLLYLAVGVQGFPKEELSKLSGRTLTLTGTVYQKETPQDDRQGGILYLKHVSLEGQEHPVNVQENLIKVLCYPAPGQMEPEIGSRIRLRGKLQCFEQASNPGQFDAHSYYQILKISCRLSQAEILAKTNTYNRWGEGLYRFRSFLSGKLSEQLSEPFASLMQTMLLGEKSGLDPELKTLFQQNGIAHILAISGVKTDLQSYTLLYNPHIFGICRG